jgi:hypothetical protein
MMMVVSGHMHAAVSTNEQTYLVMFPPSMFPHAMSCVVDTGVHGATGSNEATVNLLSRGAKVAMALWKLR